MYGKHHSKESRIAISWKNSDKYIERCINISNGTRKAMQRPEVKERHLENIRLARENLDLVWMNDGVNEYQIDRKDIDKNGYNLGRLKRIWVNNRRWY